jgi:cytidylate kinase
MASLFVISGPPGAGKSTVSRAVSQTFAKSVLLEGDAFYRFVDQGAIDPWLPAAHAQNDVVITASGAAAGRFVANGYDTVYDGVVGSWFVPTFLEATGLDELQFVVLMPTVECCVERVASRSGHGFTDEPATRHMHAQFAKEPVAARHVLAGDEFDVPSAVTEIRRRFERDELQYPR